MNISFYRQEKYACTGKPTQKKYGNITTKRNQKKTSSNTGKTVDWLRRNILPIFQL